MPDWLNRIMAAVLLVLLLPVILITALIVVIGSGWPVFFRQTRVGRDGKDFTLLKFRTMSVLKGSENGAFDAGNSRRVTGTGRLLRKSKLDELPQLWNVIRGEMALVGPRPEVRKWVKAHPERWAFVHTVRPGITDPASIEFRNEEQLLAAAADPETLYREVILPRKLDLYENYIRTRASRRDFGILLKTVGVVLFGTGKA